MTAHRPGARGHSRRALTLAFAIAVAAPCFAADGRASSYYDDALSRYERRDLPGAIIQLKNALQIDKTLLPVQVLLGKALLANGEVLTAEVALQEALRLGVNRAEVVIPLAEAYFALGRQRRVLEEPLFALAGLPRDVQVRLLLLRASGASDLGDVRSALQQLAEAATLAPRDASVALAEVPIRIRVRQFSEAEVALNKAAALAPQAPEYHYQRAALAHVQGNVAAALSAYDKTVQLERNHVEARIARAGILLDLQRDADAKQDLDALQSLLPREPRANYLRAMLAQRQGQNDAAKAALKQVTELLDPVPLDALRYRTQMLLLNGLAHFELQEREKAKTYLEALATAQPESPAVKLLARIHLEVRDPDLAIPLLETYLKAHPTDAQAQTLLAASHMATGRTARAVSLMQESLRQGDAPQHRAVLGLGLLRSGRAADGQAELEAAWRKDPTQLQAGVALTGLYLRGGRSGEAVEVAGRMARRLPQHAGLQDLLGMALAMDGKPVPARAAFDRAAVLDPAWVAPQLHLARLDAAERKFDAADARLAALVKKDDRNVDLLLELASLAGQRERRDDQVRWLVRAVDHAPRGDVRPGLALVDAHLGAGKPAQALEVARELSAKVSDSLPAMLALARAQLANGHAEGARQALSGASLLAGHAAETNVQVATMQMTANHLDGAAYSLEKALAADPASLPAQAMGVDLELRRGRPAQAEQIAAQIVRQHAGRAIGHSLQGDIARYKGQARAAVDAYRRAHALEPSSDSVLRLAQALAAADGAAAGAVSMRDWLQRQPEDLRVRRAMADAYAAAGQYAQARTAYEALLQRRPQDVGALNNLANVLIRLKDPGAIAMAERARSQAPLDAYVLDTLGWALFQLGGDGALERAVQLLRDARLREPAADIRYHLAAALAKTGRRAEARQELRAALDGDLGPDSRPDAELLAKELQ
jgi:putative PEP-CTERM system TPR-repeat lipoprotein